MSNNPKCPKCEMPMKRTKHGALKCGRAMCNDSWWIANQDHTIFWVDVPYDPRKQNVSVGIGSWWNSVLSIFK